MRKWNGLGWALAVVMAGAAPVSGEVIITEIMYNPASSERAPVRTEWVEVYNAGDVAADVSGWFLRDEDGQTEGLPAGATIAPGAAVVLIPGKQSAAAFGAAWGEGYGVFPLEGWSRPRRLAGLANSPDEGNEVLTLCAADGRVVDEVNFRGASPWPSVGKGGPSIYLRPGRVDALRNDDGANWAASAEGVDGARRAVAAGLYEAEDVGSPGRVVVKAE